MTRVSFIDDTTRKKIAEEIAKIRTEKGYTMEQFGTLLNVTRGTINNYEKGKIFPQLEVLERLAVISGDQNAESLIRRVDSHYGNRVSKVEIIRSIQNMTRDIDELVKNTGKLTAEETEMVDLVDFIDDYKKRKVLESRSKTSKRKYSRGGRL